MDRCGEGGSDPAVIGIHVVSPLVSSQAHIQSWWFGNVVDSLGGWSVPLFVMISGWLLLHSELADDPLSFYRRRLSRLLPVLVAWSVIYLIYGHFVSDNPKTLRDAFSYVLAGRPWFHLYFLYLIAGLYLVAPFLRPLVALSDRRVLGAAVLVFLAIGMVDDLILVWRGFGGVNAVTDTCLCTCSAQRALHVRFSPSVAVPHMSTLVGPLPPAGLRSASIRRDDRRHLSSR